MKIRGFESCKMIDCSPADYYSGRNYRIEGDGVEIDVTEEGSEVVVAGRVCGMSIEQYAPSIREIADAVILEIMSQDWQPNYADGSRGEEGSLDVFTPYNEDGFETVEDDIRVEVGVSANGVHFVSVCCDDDEFTMLGEDVYRTVLAAMLN